MSHEIHISPNLTGLLYSPLAVSALASLRIIGSAIGTCPANPMQNNDLSMPVFLFKEQVLMLVRLGWCAVVAQDVRTGGGDPGMKIGQEEIDRIYNTQLSEFTASKELYSLDRRNNGRTVQKPTLPLSIHLTLPISLPATPFAIPSFEFTTPRYKIFHSLSSSYWILPATKFSGDFLLYTSHPSTSHAVFIVVIVNGPMDVLDLITSARVAGSTGKILKVCWWDEERMGSADVEWAAW